MPSVGLGSTLCCCRQATVTGLGLACAHRRHGGLRDHGPEMRRRARQHQPQMTPRQSPPRIQSRDSGDDNQPAPQSRLAQQPVRSRYARLAGLSNSLRQSGQSRTTSAASEPAGLRDNCAPRISAVTLFTTLHGTLSPGPGSNSMDVPSLLLRRHGCSIDAAGRVRRRDRRLLLLPLNRRAGAARAQAAQDGRSALLSCRTPAVGGISIRRPDFIEVEGLRCEEAHRARRARAWRVRRLAQGPVRSRRTRLVDRGHRGRRGLTRGRRPLSGSRNADPVVRRARRWAIHLRYRWSAVT